MAMKKTNTNHFIIIVFSTLLLGLSFSPDRGAAQEKGKEASREKIEYIDLKISIENALNTEKENIDQLTEQELFERGINPLKALELKQTGKELNRLSEKILSMFSKDFWVNELTAIWNSENFLIVSFFIIFIIFQFLLFRLKNYCKSLEIKHFSKQFSYRLLVLQLFHRSLLLMGTTLFIYIYARIRLFYSTAPLIQIAIYILLIFLFTRWGFDLLKLWNQDKRYQIPEQLLPYLRSLLIIIRIFAIPYVILAWLIGSTSIILLVLRTVFEIILFGWNILFLRQFYNFNKTPTAEKSSRLSILSNIFFVLSYTITGGGLLLELAGYGHLALYWYKSWGWSAVIIILAGLLYPLLKEWNVSIRRISESDKDLSTKASHPIRWLFIRLCWLLWLTSLIISLIIKLDERKILS